MKNLDFVAQSDTDVLAFRFDVVRSLSMATRNAKPKNPEKAVFIAHVNSMFVTFKQSNF